MNIPTNKVLLIAAPTSSGKSLLASKIAESSWNFQKLNTKKISLEVLEQHEEKYFQSELEQANLLLKKPIKTVKSLNVHCANHPDEEARALYHAVRKKMQQHEEELFTDLYTQYLIEVDEILAQGYNCVIDHNIFLDPYPFRHQIFLKLFSKYGDDFGILNVYTKFERLIKNNSYRNKQFINFAKEHKNPDEIDKKMSLVESHDGYTSIHYRQPLLILQNALLHYEFKQRPDEEDVVLERLEYHQFNLLINEIIEQQRRLLGFLVYYRYPLVYTNKFIDFALMTKELAKVDDIIQNQRFYITNKRCKFDYLITMNDETYDQLIHQSDALSNILQELKPWLCNKNKVKPMFQSSLQFKIELNKQIQSKTRAIVCSHIFMHFEPVEMDKLTMTMLKEVTEGKVSIFLNQANNLNWQGFVLQKNMDDVFTVSIYNGNIYSMNFANLDKNFLSSIFLKMSQMNIPYSDLQVVEHQDHSMSLDNLLDALFKKINEENKCKPLFNRSLP